MLVVAEADYSKAQLLNTHIDNKLFLSHKEHIILLNGLPFQVALVFKTIFLLHVFTVRYRTL